jgi:hypothetical protein
VERNFTASATGSVRLGMSFTEGSCSFCLFDDTEDEKIKSNLTMTLYDSYFYGSHQTRASHTISSDCQVRDF